MDSQLSTWLLFTLPYLETGRIPSIRYGNPPELTEPTGILTGTVENPYVSFVHIFMNILLLNSEHPQCDHLLTAHCGRSFKR